jgi:hypothetical protein
LRIVSRRADHRLGLPSTGETSFEKLNHREGSAATVVEEAADCATGPRPDLRPGGGGDPGVLHKIKESSGSLELHGSDSASASRRTLLCSSVSEAISRRIRSGSWMAASARRSSQLNASTSATVAGKRDARSGRAAPSGQARLMRRERPRRWACGVCRRVDLSQPWSPATPPAPRDQAHRLTIATGWVVGGRAAERVVAPIRRTWRCRYCLISISMNVKSWSFALMTSCSTPASRK